MYVTSKQFKKLTKIEITTDNGEMIILNISPVLDNFEGRDILLNKISIDAPKSVKFEVNTEKVE
jgi:hypothetical protein